jgi:hypothetical protein
MQFYRRLMALAFLPAEHIVPTFENLRTMITNTSDARLVDLVGYIESTWIMSTVWPPSAWTVYKETVRTNNDVEGCSLCYQLSFMQI